MTSRILIILPSRGRSWSCLEALASIKRTAAHPDLVDVVLCQDADDSQRFSFHAPGVVNLVERRKRFCEWVNYAMGVFLKDAHSHVAWAADDSRFITQGWDDIVRSSPKLVVYGPDGVQDSKIATHPFVRVQIPKALGWLIPPELVHLCADLFIGDLGYELGSIGYFPNLRVQHLHWSVGKSVCDQTYQDAQQWVDRDTDTYYKVIAPQLKTFAQKVRASCS